ncbi:MAG: TlpA disulfide reductase family protein [Chloroflexota bacterium]
MNHRLTIAAVVLLFAAPAMLSIVAGQLAAHRATSAVGTVAPVTVGATLRGEPFDLMTLRGEVVVLNFWATWCVPCRVEMPILDRLHRPDAGVHVIAVNNAERPATVAAFVDNLGIDLPILMDPNARVQAAYGVIGYPTTVVVAPDGRIAAVFTGPITERQISDAVVDARVMDDTVPDASSPERSP